MSNNLPQRGNILDYLDLTNESNLAGCTVTDDDYLEPVNNYQDGETFQGELHSGKFELGLHYNDSVEYDDGYVKTVEYGSQVNENSSEKSENVTRVENNGYLTTMECKMKGRSLPEKPAEGGNPYRPQSLYEEIGDAQTNSDNCCCPCTCRCCSIFWTIFVIILAAAGGIAYGIYYAVSRPTNVTIAPYSVSVFYGEILYSDKSILQYETDYNNRTLHFQQQIKDAMTNTSSLSRFYNSSSVFDYSNDTLTGGVICRFALNMNSEVIKTFPDKQSLNNQILGAIVTYFNAKHIHFVSARCVKLVTDSKNYGEFSC